MTAWYVNRAAGLVAWALLAASLVLGLLLSSKLLGRRVRPNWLLDLHRGLSGLSVAFVGVHVAGAVADNWVSFGWTEVLVPGTSSWRPWAISWGVVSTYLLVAVEGSSLLRRHLAPAVWRRLHFLSFPLFLTATAHGITAGSELGTTVGIAAAATVTAGVAGLTAMRIVHELERSKPQRPTPLAPPDVRPAA